MNGSFSVSSGSFPSILLLTKWYFGSPLNLVLNQKPIISVTVTEMVTAKERINPS